MNRQHEITRRTPLLRADGTLAEPGYCKRNLFVYNRGAIGASRYRLKEWDFYQVSDGNVMVQLNLFNISYATCATFGLVDLRTGKSIDAMSIEPLTPRCNRLNLNGDRPHRVAYTRGKTKINYDVTENGRHLQFAGVGKGKRITADFWCEQLPGQESITIATAFAEPSRFFYTQKLNCMPTQGTVCIGEARYVFSKEDAYTVLDWGRGVWPHENMWYWANGSTRLDGKLFGFELTWGFGDESNATETALFYDGKCHKIGAVHLECDPEVGDKWMEPWRFISEDGRLDMTMRPFYDHQTNLMPLNLLGMKTHQVHGLWSGTAVLDDGTKLHIKDMYAFCEKVRNKW